MKIRIESKCKNIVRERLNRMAEMGQRTAVMIVTYEEIPDGYLIDVQQPLAFMDSVILHKFRKNFLTVDRNVKIERIE